MNRARIERLSVRSALAVGFCVTLGLWLYTGYALTQRIDTVRRDFADVSSRYIRAQELMSTVRSQVLLSLMRVREGLLNPDPDAVIEYRNQNEASYKIMAMALADYEPVRDSAAESEQIRKLRDEVEQLHATSMSVLAETAGRSPAAVREILNRLIVPRREAALGISEEIQARNRRAFIEQQRDTAESHRVAELQSRRNLGIALVIGLGVLLMTSWYAGRLESQLRLQMERDARISRELQNTAGKLMNAQEDERRTIARELHDEVGQVLTAIKVELALAQRAIEAGGGSAAPLVEAQSITDGALQTVRNLAQLLHPSALDDLGLPAAIDASLRGLARRQNIRAELHQMGMSDRLPRDVEVAAYRIVQEAITNVARHAQATQCQVRLTHLADRLVVEVNDNGVGFNPDDEAREKRGLGLINVRERAARLGGTFSMLSTPGHGTRLVVELPERGVLA